MKKCRIKGNRAFTLIELLVVVLIIGILAAVALPQYQKAVLKSRYSSLLPLASALNEGNENYYLSYGEYSNDLSKLDITATGTASGSTTTLPNGHRVELGADDQHNYVRVSRNDINNRVVMYQKHSRNFPGETHCEALVEDERANWLCEEALEGDFVGTKGGYNAYSMDENWDGTLGKVYHNKNGFTFTDGDVCIATSDYSCRNKGGTPVVYENATCAAIGGYYSCGGNTPMGIKATYTVDSVCIGRASGACQGAVFDHSYCVGDSAWGCCGTACRGGTFNNHSVCYALKSNACTGNYDPTSCCMGDFCTQDKCTEKEGIDITSIPPVPTFNPNDY